MTEDQWLALAERHANRDWNCRKPDGYLNAVKALCGDYAALSSASSGAGVLTEYRMFDGQWVNVVNDPSVMNADGADEAVEAAVRLTEKAMAKNIRDGNWPGGAILAATQRAEPVAQRGALAEKCRALEAENIGLIDALETARDHIDMDALEISHCKDAAKIRAALNAAPPAAVPDDCDVRRILLDVVPGFDGMGEEVFAKCNADVVAELTRLHEEIENAVGTMGTRPAAPLSEGVSGRVVEALRECVNQLSVVQHDRKERWSNERVNMVSGCLLMARRALGEIE